ncbi:7482_t:CDS:2 [Entrophospora sp. SA101]|nr:7482_t:CDS:2 [Entrophospora sp. SA101]
MGGQGCIYESDITGDVTGKSEIQKRRKHVCFSPSGIFQIIESPPILQRIGHNELSEQVNNSNKLRFMFL